MKQGRDTTQEERIRIVKDCLASGKNYGEMALKYKVSYQQVRTWTLRFEEMGEAGLEDRRGKRKKDQKPRTELEKAQIEIEQLKHKLYLAEMERDPDEVWSAVRSQIPRLVSGALAFDGVMVSATDIEALYRGKLVPSLSFEETLLALNCRTILLRTLAVTGLGPIERGAVDTPFLSEQKLRLLERDLLAGIDDTPSLRYRDASLPAGGSDDDKVFTIAAQMAILMMQYEKEWQMLHPLVRASFLFGELIRLCPFGGHDGLFALLAMDMELLAFGYPPAIIASDQCEEVRADLALTSGHGNYQRLIGFFEHSLIGSLKEMEG